MARNIPIKKLVRTNGRSVFAKHRKKIGKAIDPSGTFEVYAEFFIYTRQVLSGTVNRFGHL
jgi:hypothetical protein